MKKRNDEVTIGHFYFGILVVVIGVIGFALTFGFAPRARILPRVITILLSTMGIIEVWKAREFLKYIGNSTDNEREKFFSKTLLITLITIILYPLCLYLLGFIVSSILAVANLMYIRGIRSPRKLSLFSVFTPVAVYYLFNLMGGIRFPQGPWGF